MNNAHVELVYEQRRIDLQRLVAKMGRGACARIGEALEVEPNYISRCLYPAGKRGKKNIGDETTLKLDLKYPGWRSEAEAPRVEQTTNIRYAQFNSTISEVIEIMNRLLPDEQQQVLGAAKVIDFARRQVKAHPQERSGQ